MNELNESKNGFSENLAMSKKCLNLKAWRSSAYFAEQAFVLASKPNELIELSRSFRDLSLPEKSILCLERAMSIAHKSQEYSEIAKEFTQAGLPDLARKCCEEARSISETSLDLSSLAGAYYAIGDTKKADECLKSSKSLAESIIDHLSIAKFYIDSHDTPSADKCLSNLLEKELTDSDLTFVASMLYDILDRKKESMLAASRVENRAKNVSDLIGAAELYSSINAPAQANRCLAAAEKKLTEPHDYMSLMEVFLAHGKKEKAISLIRDLSKLGPSDFNILLHPKNFPKFLEENGFGKEAQKLLEIAENRITSAFDARHLAKAYIHIKNYDAATRVLVSIDNSELADDIDIDEISSLWFQLKEIKKTTPSIEKSTDSIKNRLLPASKLVGYSSKWKTKLLILTTVLSVALIYFFNLNRTHPACSNYYTMSGNAESISKLVEEYKKAIIHSSKRNNLLALQVAPGIGTDLVKMERFVCDTAE